MQVKELMKQAYISNKDIPLAKAANVMGSKELGSLLYVVKGKIRGIITERDLLKNFNKKLTISKVMTKKIVTIESEAEISDALEKMRNNNVKKLPVLEKGKLVGIIRLIDIATNADDVSEGFFFN